MKVASKKTLVKTGVSQVRGVRRKAGAVCRNHAMKGL